MALTWHDVFLFVPLAVVVVFEARQEFGRSLADALAGLAAFFLAAAWLDQAATTLRFSVSPDANYGITFFVLFTVLLVLGLVASRYLNATVFQLSLGTLDPPFGAVCGLAFAIIIGHALTFGITLYHGAATPE